MLMTCKADYAVFLRRFAYIEDATAGAWVRFDLWPAQVQVLQRLRTSRQLIVLKARQLGLTWVCLGFVLAEMLFKPITVALFFSRGETEAKDLLVRLKGMYSRLPDWLKDGAATIDNSQEWRLPSGSRALSFPTTGGRSYTASIVVVDEADFVENFNAVMNAVKPTIDAGGKMLLISTVDKGKPESAFKQMYRAAKRGQTQWRAIFLPWHARPGRDDDWYEAQKADVMARTGALDALAQEYPATDTEALAPNTLDKRIAPAWIEACYEEMEPLRNVRAAPSLPGFEIYRPPMPGRKYVLGADPAEGNPTSDDSALTVVEHATGEECAVLAGKVEPATFGGYIKLVSAYYNFAPAMVERNNHGHTVILWLKDNAPRVRLLHGHDWDVTTHETDEKLGWMTSTLGKALLYTEAADHFRQNADLNEQGQVGKHPTKVLHSERSYFQLASIEGATLKAPDQMHDDHAVSYCLAQVARAASIFAGGVLALGKAQGWGFGKR